jgi:hypothetical protein
MFAGLAVAFIPLGLRYLCEALRPPRRMVWRTAPLLLVFAVASIVLGQLG